MFCNICGSLLLGIPNENGVVTCFECYDDAKPDDAPKVDPHLHLGHTMAAVAYSAALRQQEVQRKSRVVSQSAW